MKQKVFILLALIIGFSGINANAEIFSEELYLPVNGDEQRIIINAADTTLPVLLFLHGYATPTSVFAHYYSDDQNSALMRNFVLVHWDQRGAGASYSPKTAPETMTQQQFVDDMHVVVEYLKKRFHKDNIHLMAQSWGSIIGMKYLVVHPENIASYVGEGQISHYSDALRRMHKFALEKANEEGNKKAIRQLSALSIPGSETSAKERVKFNKRVSLWADFYMSREYPAKDLTSEFKQALKTSPYYKNFSSKMNVLKGMSFTQKTSLKELMQTDLSDDIKEVDVPVCYIVGEYDFLLMGTRELHEHLMAPQKEFVLVRNAGHAPSLDKPGEFENAVIKFWGVE